MLIAKDFIILRGIRANGRESHPVERKPVRVATMIDEARFNELGCGLIHNSTVFFEDQWHDWAWEKGRFRYFTRVAETADVVLVFEEADLPPVTEGLFCTQCGTKKPSASSVCTNCPQ